VAVWPDRLLIDRLRGLGSALHLDASGGRFRPVPEEQLHVTLCFLGDVPESVVDPVIEALGRGAAVAAASPARLPSLLLARVGPATAWFSRERVLQLPVSGLDELAAAIRDQLSRVPDVELPVEPFLGHLTLGRARNGLAKSWRRSVAGLAFEHTLEVGCFSLVASELSPEGARYRRLAEMHVGPRL
jgi:2'-5' RNA ligase